MAFQKVANTVPKSFEIKKLQIKHAVTEDMKKINLALDAFHKSAAKDSYLGIMPSLNQLLDALKKWKADNGKKHPKFVKAIEDTFEKPILKILAEVQKNSKMPSNINTWRNEALKRCNEAAKILTGLLDASKIKDARKAMEKIGAPLNGIATSANSIKLIGDDSAVWVNLFDEAGEAKKKMQEIDKVLAMFEKNNVDKVPAGHQQTLIKALAGLVTIINGLKAPLG
jgi:hypothetical protein